ncbi:c-di-GMP-binding flagellar brake protein YcgR, contains PilZNR and PilZ domains [Amphibacillus marinus]|uniref:C-di-GMP-binding flagellar brake protein YcgR, contains PilZNR and PilZ domains n=1 Tax=Amphibacillus marinus TaxID=872970 RepID=A0A1H8GDX9_9BACI|nr:flagellar brake domain-containing protein [Amphibacillus marinus]SEN42222.1 c-di-GMP-binding flagellar brake protein YcgR, contains PilZNR and PilZ domains [Amphibacillus marinus]
MIKIGTVLTLQKQDVNNQVENYKCRISDFKGHTLYIDYPINTLTGHSDIFARGDQLVAYFITPNQGVYRFVTVIKGRKKDKIPLLLLHFDQSKLEKVQRRDYVRVTASLDIAVQDPSQKIDPFHTVTSDISGGGVAIYVPDDRIFYEGMKVNVVIVLRANQTSFDYIYADANVIRTQSVKHASIFKLSLAFNSIAEKDRQRIIHFCFNTELEERRQQFK